MAGGMSGIMLEMQLQASYLQAERARMGLAQAFETYTSTRNDTHPQGMFENHTVLFVDSESIFWINAEKAQAEVFCSITEV